MARRIGFDLQAGLDPNPSGLGYYVNSLYQALKDNQPSDLEIVGLRGRGGDLSTLARVLHDRFELPRLAKQARVEAIHQPAFSAPKSNLPVIWTLHDLRALTANEAMSAAGSWYWRKYLPYSARWADRIVCTSPSTIPDALKYLGRPKNDYQVIPIGLPSKLISWRPSGQLTASCLGKFNLNQPYFVTVGTIQPVKNIPFLISVLARLVKDEGTKRQLVIIGKKGWGYPEVQTKLKELGLIEGRDVVITDYLTDEEKWSLIAGAQAFLFPSKYEGFGIPPLEAQSLGVPVIASNTSSIPWVLGKGAIFAPPDKIEPWLSALPTLERKRQELIKIGRENAKRFDWQEIARQWLAVYQEVTRG